MAIANPTQDAIGFPVADTERYGDWSRLLRAGDFEAFSRSLVEWNRQLAETANLAMQGKTNNTGLLTVGVGVTVITGEDFRIGLETKVILVPLDEPTRLNASYYQEFPNVKEGEARLRFAADPSNDRNFAYILVG